MLHNSECSLHLWDVTVLNCNQLFFFAACGLVNSDARLVPSVATSAFIFTLVKRTASQSALQSASSDPSACYSSSRPGVGL